MKLPFDLLSQNYIKPNLYLCETDKTKICRLEATDMQATLKFNAYSELSFTVARTYDDMIKGEQKVNPFYNRIEALRLVYLDGFGYFEIQDPELISDGIQEKKEVLAYSLEYNLSQKYLDDFHVNTGEIDSIEVIYAEDNNIAVSPVVFYNPANENLSLLHLILEKVYGWTIGHVDTSLYTISRTFDVSRSSVYDFIMQDICEKFNCFAVFDTVDNTINFYSEVLISKFIGNGDSTEFIISPPYNSIGVVSIDTYKTSDYTYNDSTGILTFKTPPTDGAMIEVRDGAQTPWLTDVYVSFDNLAQEVNVSYSADDIKTVLTVKGADDLDIREVNFGLPYITDLSYYYNVDWMGNDLYDAYTSYMQLCSTKQDAYKQNSKEMLDASNYISYEKNRLSYDYIVADDVTSITVGEYYVRGGTEPNYYYKEVSLPTEYNADVTYYKFSGSYITEKKIEDFYSAIQNYYVSGDKKDTSEIKGLKESFACMKVNTIDVLDNRLSSANTTSNKDNAIKDFLTEVWNQFGKDILTSLYLSQYKTIKETNEKAEWNDPANTNYWRYYPVNLMIETIEAAIVVRTKEIDTHQRKYDSLIADNKLISESLLMQNNFTDKQLVRLSSFLREDEYTNDNFVETDSDTIETLMQTKQELLENGKIELSKLCAPKLEFSMNMANIFALREFDPIINQFQLGNLINVAIRSDYVKHARLLEVDINFEDFSDFSCAFGELTNLKTPSSIHADLLASAINAGKSVASNASYWNKGSDTAIATDLKLQQGLLDATNAIKAIDGTQGVVIDKYGIHLRNIDPDTGELDSKEGWIVNNQFLYSDDNFKSTKSVFGEYVVDNTVHWGLLAEAVLAGYIEGSKIVGGTINIGDGTFVVDARGNVTMKASNITGYVGNGNVISMINQSPESITINANKISLSGKNINLTSDNITISSTNFSVTKDGKITAKEADITGKITASSGTIGGWTIDTNSISGTSGNYKALISKSAIGQSDNVVFGVYDGSKWSCYMDGVGKLYASNADIQGKITATSGSIAGYNIGSGGSYSNAIYKRVDGSSSDYEVGMKATSGATDLAFYVKESTDNWANSTNTFYIRNNGQLYAQDAVITGEINATSGNIGGCTISNGVLNVDAARITSGTIATARIPNLSADKITAGTIHVDRIPNISAGKITSGTINASNVSVTNLNASNITSGTLSTSRLSSSVITTDNFSSKSLSTGSLTVASGCRLGAASEYNALLYTVGDYTNVRAFGPDVNYGISWYALIKQAVQLSASSRDIKTEIHDFDDRYDEFFNNLNPQLYKYDFATANGYSMGYIWEETKDASLKAGLANNDIGAVSETESVPGGKELNRTDFIALNTWQIQKLKARVEELENKLAALEA